GGDRYHVRLTIGERALDASCTCPVGATFCKHAVAVALAFVAKQTRPAPQQATLPLPLPLPQATVTAKAAGFAARGPLPEDAGGDGNGDQGAPASDANSFATRAELEAWAEAHQVTHALWLSAEILYPQLPAQEAQRYGLRYVLGRLALRD